MSPQLRDRRCAGCGQDRAHPHLPAALGGRTGRGQQRTRGLTGARQRQTDLRLSQGSPHPWGPLAGLEGGRTAGVTPGRSPWLRVLTPCSVGRTRGPRKPQYPHGIASQGCFWGDMTLPWPHSSGHICPHAVGPAVGPTALGAHQERPRVLALSPLGRGCCGGGSALCCSSAAQTGLPRLQACGTVAAFVPPSLRWLRWLRPGRCLGRTKPVRASGGQWRPQLPRPGSP